MAASKVKSSPPKAGPPLAEKLKVQSGKKGSDFPQIFRKITAFRTSTVQDLQRFFTSIHVWRWILVLLITAVVLLQLVKIGQTLYVQYNEAQLKQAEKAALEGELAKWERIANEKPNYRDAYFELAVLTYRLNRIEESRAYLEKVFALDPNFQPARELEKTVNTP